MKLIKYLLIAVGSLIALLVLAAVLIMVFVDPNDYKPEIQDAVYKNTGMELVLDGDLSLSFFPWLGVDLGAASIANPPDFGDTPFAKLESASVSLKVLPLLSGNIEVGKVMVDGLNLNMIKNEQGVGNWESFKKPEEEAQAEAPEAETPETPKDGAKKGMAEFSLGGLELTKANIFWNDQTKGKVYALKDADITIGSFTQGKPFDFTMEFGLIGSEPAIAARIKAGGTLALDMETGQYALKDFAVDSDLTGDGLPEKGVVASVRAQSIMADLEKQTASISGLVVSTGNAEITGSVTASGITSQPVAEGALEIKPFDARVLMADMDMKVPETADPNALKRIGGSVRFKYTTEKIDMPFIKLNLDENEIDAALSMKPGDVAYYNFSATTKKFNVDNYLPPRNKGGSGGGDSGGGEQSAPASQAQAPATEDPLAPILKTLNMDGEIKIGELIVSGMDMHDVTVVLKARDGVLDLKPFSLNMFGGNINSALTLNGKGQKTRGSLFTTITNLDTGAMVVAITGKESLAGTLNLKSVEPTTWTGLDPNSIKYSLSGLTVFRINDGVFPGVDLGGMISDLPSLGGDDTLESQPSDRTRFGELRGTIDAKTGRITCDDLAMKSPHIRADGKGTVDLPTDDINYLVRAKLVLDDKGQGGTESKELYGILVPVRVSGSLSDPHYWVSGEEYLKALGQNLLETPEAAVDLVGDVLGGAGDFIGVGGEEGAEAGAAEGGAAEGGEKSGGVIDDVGGALESINPF